MKMNERKIDSLIQRAMSAEADLKAERLKNLEMSERMRRMEDESRSLRDEVRTLRETNSSQMDQIQRNVQMLADFLLGKGPVSISDELRKAVEDGIRAEYDARMTEKDTEIAALKDTIAALKNGNGGNGLGIASGSIAVMDAAAAASLEQQNKNLRTQAYGKKSEKNGTVQTGAQMSADEMDLEGMETVVEVTPEEAVVMAAAQVKAHAKPGPKGKHSEHPAAAFAESPLVLEPKDLPKDAKLLSEKECDDTVVKIYWIEGHVRIVKIRRPKYYKDGRHYQAPAPKFLLGNTQIDISFMVQLLEMFVVQKVTIGTIEEWIADQGLDFDHATVIGWIRKAADLLEPIDGPLHDAITAEDNNHVDETTIRVCDKPLKAAKAQSEDLGITLDPEEEEQLAAMEQKHYFVRWLYAFFAPANGLVQYVFHNRGSRSGTAVDEYYKDVGHKIYLHSDGAKMYDKYDSFMGNLVKIGCGVHLRRHFFKLKDTSKDAYDFVTDMDNFFHAIAAIKKRTDDIEERKRQQLIEGMPILVEVLNKIEILLKTLDKATSPDLFKALLYAKKELPSIMRAFERGDLEFSNNLCEQQMRRIAQYRNNSLHCGSVESTVRWARLQSLAQSCRNNGKNFKRYIKDLLTTILTQPKEMLGDKLSKMLPHLWTDPVPFAIPLTSIEPTDSELLPVKNI